MRGSTRSCRATSTRDGFRFLGAFADGGSSASSTATAAGRGSGGTTASRRRSAPRATERWLGPGHFEFTELHVRPEFRRRGIGGSLHDALLEGIDAPTAVLSTQTDNEPAIALYAGRGWQVIVPYLDFGSGRPFLIMGRDLR